MTQKEALTILKTGACVFLTGEPGSGKSHTTREYVNYLRRAKIEVAITASTGIAATHIGGITIHSWSGIGIKKNISKYDLDRIAANERLSKRIARTKVLIIDEISMLDSETLESVDRVCREMKRNNDPFGGMQVVLVGDFFQLPPISKFDEPDAKFAFEADVWQRAKFLTCYLSEQYRQDDRTFLDILSAVRRNTVDAEHRAHLDGRCMEAADYSWITRLFSHNVDVDRINNEELRKIPGEIKSFKMQGAGKGYLVDLLKRNCLSPEILQLKKGATVMFTKNNPKSLFVNGTLGTVVDWHASGLPIVETLTGRRIEAEPMEWAVEDNGRVLARIQQIPLRLAWAITIHKSQGMSLDAAYIDLRDAFVEGQGYVALSRVRSLKGLFLAGYNEQALRVHGAVLQNDEEFRAQSDEAAAIFSRMSAVDISKMHQNFIKALGGKLPVSVETDKAKVKRKVYSLELIRQKHPNAYQPWSKEEDLKLTEYFRQGKKTKDLSELFGRQGGAIRSRLRKIGLVV